VSLDTVCLAVSTAVTVAVIAALAESTFVESAVAEVEVDAPFEQDAIIIVAAKSVTIVFILFCFLNFDLFLLYI
jgi:hypothetical protein